MACEMTQFRKKQHKCWQCRLVTIVMTQRKLQITFSVLNG